MPQFFSSWFSHGFLKKYQREILLFLALFGTGAAFHHPVEYDNTLSRYFLVHSVVERGVLNIDDNHEITIDDSFWDGHYYSNKAIGAPLLGVPFYWVVNKLPFRKTSYAELNVSIEEMYLVRVVTTTAPFALLGALLFNFSVQLKRGKRESLWMVLSYGFGTIALVHAMLFSGHQIAASFSFFSFFILYRLKENRKRENTQRVLSFFAAGLLAGLAALADYTAMYIALCLTMYLFSLRLSLKENVFFLSGGCLCVSLLAGYNYQCFDSPLSLSYGHLVEQDFSDGAKRGFLGVSLPDPMALFSLLFSPSRGLFFISPVLLYALLGLYEMRKEYLRETVLIVMLCVGYLIINSGFYGWHGGWSYGPRYLVPVLPFLVFPMVFCKEGFNKPFLVLFFLSFVQVSLAAFGVPHTPDRFTNPIVDFMVPLIEYGYVAKNVGNVLGIKWVYGALPVLLAVGGLICFAFFRLSPLEFPNPLWKKRAGLASVALTVYILVKLSITPSGIATDQNHIYKSNMLYMYSKVTNSEEVYIAGLQEELKARNFLEGQEKAVLPVK